MEYKDNILIAEDEPKLLEVLCDYFISRGDVPWPAKDGIEALKQARQEEFDAVLLDIMMPGLDGFEVCRALRKKSNVPILFLTALSEEEETLFGYQLGADDYITKPFSMSVLYAKTKALIRRNRGFMMSGDQLAAGNLVLSLSSRHVEVKGERIGLSPKEYELLLCLMQHKNMVMSRDQLLSNCWGYDYEGDVWAVDTHIKRLREKLGEEGACIKTVIKAGYRLEG